jgi:hypothetical protein
VAQGEQVVLFHHVQRGFFKQQLASDEQSLLTHRLPVMGQTLEKQTYQVLTAFFID